MSNTRVVEFVLNGQKLSVNEGTTVLQAAMQTGVEVPYFCYHPRLSVAGNCRMCLVEVEGVTKPQASCMTLVRADMIVNTQSAMTRKAQEGAMEFLLLNHPLDCPICDQGGECDLQNIAFRYGRGNSRSCENKRAVSSKNMGPLVGTAMTRCIHCTRCIRFAKEIAGVPELNIQGRGEHAEILTYVGSAIQSELSGNLVDICPVGALTNKPYGMQWRPWELVHTPTIDVMDGMGSHIYVDTHNNKIMRVRPRACESINQEWLADRGRYAVDGLKYQRLEKPAFRQKDGLLQIVSWQQAVDTIADLFQCTPADETAVLVGDLVDVETAVLLKHLCDDRGIVHRDSRVAPISTGHRRHYTIPTLAEVDEADAVLLVDVFLRRTAPLLNIRLRNKKVAYVGQETDYTYPTTWLGQDFSNLKESSFYASFKSAKKPLILIDPSVYNNSDFCRVINTLMAEIPALNQPDWLGFGCVTHTAGQVGALDTGLVPGEKGCHTADILNDIKRWKLLFLVGFDDPRLLRASASNTIYIGHHYDVGAERADVVLPTHAYTEKETSYTNIMGSRQTTKQAVKGLEDARTDWCIIQALHQKLGGELSLRDVGDIVYPQSMLTAWRPLPVLSEAEMWQEIPLGYENVIARYSPTWRAAKL